MAFVTSDRASVISGRSLESPANGSEAKGVGDKCSIISLLEDASNAWYSLIASSSPKSASRASAGGLVTEELDREQRKRLLRD
jgi:hypothetical protein